MSTLVSDFIDEIQDRIPEEQLPNIFSALNRAIKVASKRLYILGSSLIISELSISAFASVDYTTDTIAFVDGGVDSVDTITDSDSAFVTEGFEVDMPIETDCAGNLGPFRITAVAAGTLTLHADAAVTAQAAGSSYTITSVADYGYLPDDFGGFVEKPYMDGYTWELDPLPSQREKLTYSSAGTPQYYKLKGNLLHLIPATNTDITIKGDYFKAPTAITKMSNYVPFYGVLDEALQEYLIAVLGGKSNDAAGVLISATDLAVQKRDKKAPTSMPGGINWGF